MLLGNSVMLAVNNGIKAVTVPDSAKGYIQNRKGPDDDFFELIVDLL